MSLKHGEGSAQPSGSEGSREPVVIEINLSHLGGEDAARDALLRLLATLVPGDQASPMLLSTGYMRANLTRQEMRDLVQDDSAKSTDRQVIAGIWPDFPISLMIDRSIRTIKAKAARTAFDAYGRGIVWGVVDSGIDASHPHFHHYNTLGGEAQDLHRDFSSGLWPPTFGQALDDPKGHGTHVAGILAGGLSGDDRCRVRVAEHHSIRAQLLGNRQWGSDKSLLEHSYDIDTFTETERLRERKGTDLRRLAGVAPETKLVSLKVLDNRGQGYSSGAILALRYIREVVNADNQLRIHGVNLSLGYEINARSFGAGLSPLCTEVDRLVSSGVVVVAAAGNTGYGEVSARTGVSNAPLLSTINDPGNARGAITVGSVHRTDPHMYGVSYFSSKGPTADGRLKPDVVAPGERITSCAAGKVAARVASACGDGDLVTGTAYYVDLDGTSMAAPHVSGAIAAFLSARREYLGRPGEVKRIFLESATSLGRNDYFQGHGLIDMARAMQIN